jgi:hypothetical protein
MNKIGYILIENYQTDKPKVCETPRHKNFNLRAYAVMAISYTWHMQKQTVVQMVCYDCWKRFDDDMKHPKWNLME